MEKFQGIFFTGYVTIAVKGRLPELFFQACMKEGIPAWNVKKTGTDTCQGNIKLEHISTIRKLRRQHEYRISFIRKQGYPFLWRRFLRRKEIVAAALLSVLLITFLSNIVWKVDINGVPLEIEAKVEKQLKGYGIHPGAWTFSLEPPSVIQQKLLHDVPELLWIGVKRRGTALEFQGVEKTIVQRQKVKGPRNLVAAKKGIIQKMYVSRGLPTKEVHDYVEAGDLLVSGEIGSLSLTEQPEDGEEKDKNQKRGKLVAAEGDIRARTWYETKVSVPLEAGYETLTGNQEKKYYVRVKDFYMPVWNLDNPDYKETQRENHETPIRFIKWDLPLKFVATTLSEKEPYFKKRTREEAVAFGIEQARQELQLQLGPEAEIQGEKILHENIENGKVELTLYLTAEENIVKEVPIE